MLKVDTTGTEASLEKAKLKLKEKLEYMVASFARDVTAAASQSTPIGDAEALQNRPSYRNFYLQRAKPVSQGGYGIDAEVGFHAGAWVYSDDTSLAFDSNIYTNEEAEGKAFADAKSGYQLGETFYIVGQGPAFIELENGLSPKAPNGIIKPTEQVIESTYRVNLKSAYDRG